MKITFLSLFLLIALSTKPQPGAAGRPTPEQVVDTTGNKVLAGYKYYIVPASSDVGGVALASTYDECPLDVVAVNGSHGWPVTFLPSNNKSVIRESIDLNIFFTAKTSCPQSTVWMLKYYDSFWDETFVTSGGVVGKPGVETVENWFNIEKYEDAYKLVYCPSVCRACSYPCGDLGLFNDGESTRLALTNSQPYKVKFQRA